MRNVILSGFSDEYALSFEEQLAGMKSLGLEFIEVRGVDGKNVSTLNDGEVCAMKGLLDSYGIGVSAIGSPLGKVALDSDLEEHMEVAERVFCIANTVGAKYVRMFSFYPPKGGCIADMEREVVAALEPMVLLARKHGVTLCHENEARIYGDIPERCRRLLDHFGGELKCVFDMGNFVLEGVYPYPRAYELLKNDIAYFHIKDALPEGAVVPAGEGDARIADIIKAHRESAEEDFFVSMEPHLQLISEEGAMVSRRFTNPYVYPDSKTAFTDAVNRFKALI
jgi:sugar phosphate isomerase/epimerase